MPFNPEQAISADRIVDLESTKKSDVLDELISLLAESDKVNDPGELRRKIYEREKTVSTGVGAGMAIPHVKIPSITDFVAAIGRSKRGIQFDSLDGQPTHIVVMIGCNNTQSADFLKILARLVTRLKDESVKRRIMDAETPEDIRSVFTGQNGILA